MLSIYILYIYWAILLTKINSAKDEVVLSYYRVRTAQDIFSGSYFSGGYNSKYSLNHHLKFAAAITGISPLS